MKTAATSPSPPPAEPFLARWVGFVARHALWIVIAFVLIAVLAFFYTSKNLGINTNTDDMLSEELPFRRTNARFQEAFPQFAGNLIVVVDAVTPERARDAARALGREMSARPELYLDVVVPLAEPFLERHALLYLDEDELDDLAARLAEIQPFLGRLTRDGSLRGLFDMLERALEERIEGGAFDVTPLVEQVSLAIGATLASRPHEMSWQALMDEDDADPRTRQLVVARAVTDYGSLFPAGRPIEEARRIFDRLADASELPLHFRITGGLAMEHEELLSVRRGAEWIGLATLVLVGFVLALGLRSLRLVVASLITLIVGLVITAAFATAAIGHLNLVSVAFGVLYIGLGVDYAIHLGLRYRESVGRGRTNLEAIQRAACDVGGSLVLCTITTAIGFYAFVPTAYAGVSELGLISGTGMFVSLVVTLTLMPALLTLAPLGYGRAQSARRPGRVASWLLDLPVRRRGLVLGASAALALGALALLERVEFDVNPVNLRDPRTESVATFKDLLATSETPPWSVTLLAPNDEEATRLARDLDGLAVTDEVVRLESFVPENQDEKTYVLEDLSLTLGPGFASIAKKDAPTFEEQRAALAGLTRALGAYLDHESGARDVAAHVLAERLGALDRALDTGEATRLLEALERSLLATLPSNLERLDAAIQAEPFAANDLPGDLARRWRSPEGLRRVEAFPAENLDDIPALRGFVEAVRGVSPEATGAPVMIVESGGAIVGAFRQALAFALVACGLVLLVLLRSVRDTLLVLAPLAFAGLLTAAATVVLDVPFNFANVIALPLLLGIGVDSGIHVVHRARGPLPASAGGNPVRTSTGRAVVYSALTTTCSFGSLAFSPHPGTASMGLILAVGMLLTLVATLILLPALLGPRPASTLEPEPAPASAS